MLQTLVTFFEYKKYETYFVSHMVDRDLEIVCAAAWFFVGIATIWATFSPKIKDTVLERIAIAFVSITSFSRAIYVFTMGNVALDGVLTAIAIAMYCVVIWNKHSKERAEQENNRRKDDLPNTGNLQNYNHRRKDDLITEEKKR